MAPSTQNALGVDTTFIAKVKVVLVRKAAATASKANKNDEELRLASNVLTDPDTWAARAAYIAASLVTEAIGAPTQTPTLTSTSDDNAIRDAVIVGPSNSVWAKLIGTI